MRDDYTQLAVDLMELVRDTDNALRDIVAQVLGGNMNDALLLLGMTAKDVRLKRDAFETRVTALEGGEE